jgi:hypothetical protein
MLPSDLFALRIGELDRYVSGSFTFEHDALRRTSKHGI